MEKGYIYGNHGKHLRPDNWVVRFENGHPILTLIDFTMLEKLSHIRKSIVNEIFRSELSKGADLMKEVANHENFKHEYFHKMIYSRLNK